MMQKLEKSNDKFISTADAARMFNVSQAYIRRLVAERKINGIKIGNTWIILKSEIEKYDIKRK